MLPAFWLVLVNPGVPVATGAVFAGARRPLLAGAAATARLSRRGRASPGGFVGQRNDLEAAAVAVAPPIADVLAAIAARRGCLLARMSGSGATCFGLFATAAAAEAAAADLDRARPGLVGIRRARRAALISIAFR